MHKIQRPGQDKKRNMFFNVKSKCAKLSCLTCVIFWSLFLVGGGMDEGNIKHHYKYITDYKEGKLGMTL